MKETLDELRCIVFTAMHYAYFEVYKRKNDFIFAFYTSDGFFLTANYVEGLKTVAVYRCNVNKYCIY